MTYQELKYRQSWTLFQKIDHAVGVIEQFIARLDGKVYVSFSGGKDSTVLLDIVRRFIDPNCLAVFCNTGNEHAEIIRFVKTVENVQYIKPRRTFKQIVEKYGFPIISKEQAQYIRQAKHTKSEKLRYTRLFGKIGRNGKNITQGVIAKKWQYLIHEEFDLTDKCCYYLKKEPFKRFNDESGLFPIIGTMVVESRLRFQKWLKTGCDSFESNQIGSYPLSIFTESDTWAYIRYFNVPYCPVYDDGEDRTGCVMCGFGAHMQGDDCFYRLKRRKPQRYSAILNLRNNGITYWQALQCCNIDFPDAINRQLRIEF